MQDTRTIRTFVQDSERSSKREERTLAREVDVRPETSGRSSSMQSGRSSKCERERTLVLGRGRSSSQAGARPRERTFVQEDARPRTLVPEAGARPREGDARPEAAGARPRSRRSSSQAEVDARPARQRTFVQNARPNERTLVHARGRSSMQEDVRPAEVDVRPLSASREFHARA
ncbi:hypothetical protein LR48_Vigan13s000700 [Vigna angularis]|uniref:Uncharacterized protein n=1 Tax=Phaseolus angularis TaxID=3914 RepID=A0A0L9T489_PHAAN|nr:hypothetical protein LR48_Vigan13s000700 [Vigna angularis]